jgi:hypothetical protein
MAAVPRVDLDRESWSIHQGEGIVRVTADTKLATRGRILDAARELFVRVGFDVATTRDIASAAGIATGTL